MKEPTVAERMAALIEQNKNQIPDWARWACVNKSGSFEVGSQKPLRDTHVSFFRWARLTKSSHIGFAEHLSDNWEETLTELATIKPGLTVARTVQNDRIVDNNEMVKRDEREPTLKEKHVMWKADQAEISPIPRQLTIPSICLADQAMPMMLGGGFGGRYE